MIDPTREQDLYLLEQQTVLEGRFTQIARLGPSGGNGYFSLMLTAYDSITGKQVVLKVFNPKVTNAYRLASFEREAKLLGRFANDDHILKLVSPQSTLTVSLPLVPGQTYDIIYPYFAVEKAKMSVADVIASNRWNAEKLLRAFRAMCRAVQRIHNVQIVHRDLKPDNYLVMGDGSIKLSDFGTARLLDKRVPALAAQYSGPPGDLFYAAPEVLSCLQEEESVVAYWADIYALGATLFELFSGTKLGLRILDPQYRGALMQHMAAIPIGQRRDIYDQFVRSIVAKYPLPSVTSFGAVVPSCIADRIDALYRSMASLDYRERLRTFGRGIDRHEPISHQLAHLTRPSFDRILKEIDACLVMLASAQALQRRHEMRQKRRNVPQMVQRS